MHPPYAPIVDALLERRMNGGAALDGRDVCYRTKARRAMGLRGPPEILLPDAMRAPDVSPSSAEPKLERREPDRERPILDPRNGDAEDDVSSPKQKSLLAIAGSLLAEISLTKLLLAWIASILLPAAILGLAPLIVTAWVGGVFSRSPGIVRIRRRACASRDRRRRLVRLASLVSRRGSEFLGAQRAWRSARIRLVPRGDPSFS